MKISGDNQQGEINTTLVNPFVVEVQDGDDTPFEGVTVTFTATTGGGTLSVASTTTGANGRAESTLTLGSEPGTNTVEVSVKGISQTETFTAQGTAPPPTPTRPLKISGDNQQGEINTTLVNPFVVEVQDGDDAPFEGVTVTFTATTGGGTLSVASTTTGANGRAESTLTLGSEPGTNTVEVSVEGIFQTITFTAQGTAPPPMPTRLLKISGDNQQGEINTTLVNPFVVEVQDGDDAPFEGATVIFTVTTGDGRLSVENTLTNVDGRAESTLTLGSEPGTNTVEVSVEGIFQTITFTAVVETSGFDLFVPSGISLIHVPLKVTAVDGMAKTIESIGDLYDALSGPNAVNYLVIYDLAIQRWISYIGARDRGTFRDKALTADLGIATVMEHAVTLRLRGNALGTPLLSSLASGGDREALITVHSGTNFVGVPLRDSRIVRVSDLFTLDGIRDSVVDITVSDGGKLKTVRQVGDDGDIPVIGGQSFILTAREATMVAISGTGWTNTSTMAAAPLMAITGIEGRNATPILALSGSIIDEVTGTNGAGFRVIVRNLSTRRAIATATGDEDLSPLDQEASKVALNPDPIGGIGYRLTVVDMDTGRAAQVGDILEISAQSPDPLIGVQPLRYTVMAEDVKRNRIQLPALVAYEIPGKTALLRNYPNPFNPETWIPYRLAEDAFVTLTIYDLSGRVVRTLEVGHRIAAVYESRSKAVYWDGRNEVGERVASGVYFYQLSAGDYSATRKMLIIK